MITARLHIRRKDRTLDRREVLSAITSLRRLRDRSRRGAVAADDARDGMFERGMSAGYHFAAHVIWSEYENGRS